VLADGRVAERGTDAELRAAGGLYGRMLRAGGLA
jgi:ABC-type multidrug transport system fused ATPase/permease subunit